MRGTTNEQPKSYAGHAMKEGADERGAVYRELHERVWDGRPHRLTAEQLPEGRTLEQSAEAFRNYARSRGWGFRVTVHGGVLRVQRLTP